MDSETSDEEMKKPTKRERAEDFIAAVGPTVGGAAGGTTGALMVGPIGGLAGGALGGLIPSLARIPAAKRHQKRIEDAIREVEERLSKDHKDHAALSDKQFKILSECILTLGKTVEAEKVEYLKTIMITSASYEDYQSYESILLSRNIRDISAEEIAFLIESFSYKSINIYSWSEEESGESEKKTRERLDELSKRIKDEGGLLLLLESQEALVANGLVNLGVLKPDALSLGVHKYRFAKVWVKLLALLNRSQ